MAVIKCINCSSEFDLSSKVVLCPKCNNLLQVEFKKIPRVSWSVLRSRPFRLWRYRELIPIPKDAQIISLNEGGTPLIKLVNLVKELGVKEVYVKFDGANPTGSFKDRGMTVAISMAKYLRVPLVACASTGNTSASVVAYAARAGIKSLIIVPKGKIARGKLAQAILHGAIIISIKGSFDIALEVIIKASKKGLIYSLNSINPWRIEGQKTVAYEIIDEIDVPDWIIVPVGNAGNISAIWKGLVELKKFGLINKLPRLAGIQATGAAPLVKAFREGLEKPEFIDDPKTIASAIRIGKPINWFRALKAVRDSKGIMMDVTDEEILEAQKLLARYEGLGVEPASAASIAGLKKLRDEGVIDPNDKVVAIATGHALKDPDTALLHNVVTYEVGNTDEALSILEKIIQRTN